MFTGSLERLKNTCSHEQLMQRVGQCVHVVRCKLRTLVIQGFALLWCV